MYATNWDYLRQGNSRVPINAIPEPTVAALLLLGGGLLWQRARPAKSRD